MTPIASPDMIDLDPNARRILWHLIDAVITNMASPINEGYREDKHRLNKQLYEDTSLNHMLDQIHWLDQTNRAHLWHMIRGLPPGHTKQQLCDAADQLHLLWTK